MQADFKGQWAVLMSILPDGMGAADMLCRILVAIDEDIVSLDIPRSPDGVRASMEFKVCPVMTYLLLLCLIQQIAGLCRAPSPGCTEVLKLSRLPFPQVKSVVRASMDFKVPPWPRHDLPPSVLECLKQQIAEICRHPSPACTEVFKAEPAWRSRFRPVIITLLLSA